MKDSKPLKSHMFVICAWLQSVAIMKGFIEERSSMLAKYAENISSNQVILNVMTETARWKTVCGLYVVKKHSVNYFLLKLVKKNS